MVLCRSLGGCWAVRAVSGACPVRWRRSRAPRGGAVPLSRAPPQPAARPLRGCGAALAPAPRPSREPLGAAGGPGGGPGPSPPQPSRPRQPLAPSQRLSEPPRQPYAPQARSPGHLHLRTLTHIHVPESSGVRRAEPYRSPSALPSVPPAPRTALPRDRRREPTPPNPLPCESHPADPDAVGPQPLANPPRDVPAPGVEVTEVQNHALRVRRDAAPLPSPPKPGDRGVPRTPLGRPPTP